MQRWDPYEDKKIHGPFKNGLRKAKDEEDGVYIGLESANTSMR